MTLQETLLQAEQLGSPLTQRLNGLPLQRLKDLQQPVGFSASGEALPVLSDSPAITAALPNLAVQGLHSVLQVQEGGGALPTGLRVAALFSGGPAPGGHNVLCGLFDVLGDTNTLIGVCGGPKGLLKGQLKTITAKDIEGIQNTGGFDFLGTDRTKIKTPEQFEQVRQVCRDAALDALVIIGGDDSNTNAAFLAECLFANVHTDGRGVQVIGVPKTIDGDLQCDNLLPISFGFDTATKVYAEMVGNILQDAKSSLKYWHFIKLMGRAASHVTLEVALQTKPAVTLISEELAEKSRSLADVVEEIASAVRTRATQGIFHGVVLIPEGLIEFIPEMRALIDQLNTLAAQAMPVTPEQLQLALPAAEARLFNSLPSSIQQQLLSERDAHGNLPLSQLPTEVLLLDMVRARLAETAPKIPFAAQQHFFGYEGRCGAPSLFDAHYTFNLGVIAGALIGAGKTGYMAAVGHFAEGVKALAIPLAGLLQHEQRHGKAEAVIAKALVDLNAPAMQYFIARRAEWAVKDCFTAPGPRQYWGPVAMQAPMSVALNQGLNSLSFSFNPA